MAKVPACTNTSTAASASSISAWNPPLALLAIEVGAAVAHHDPADETDQACHRGADQIGAQCEPGRALEQACARHRTKRGLHQPAEREREGEQGRPF